MRFVVIEQEFCKMEATTNFKIGRYIIHAWSAVERFQYHFPFFFCSLKMAEGASSTESSIDHIQGQKFLKSFLSAFDNQQDCDIFFNVNGECIGAHKMVLKNTAKGLHELQDQLIKGNHIYIESIDFDAFKSLLR